MNNGIYIRRRSKIFIEKGTGNLPLNYVGSILKNIENLGYTFSEPLIERLQTLESIDDLAEFYRQTVEDLRKMVGSHREYKPMYPNFPQQVMDMTEVRLYVNAIIHYLTNRLPNYVKDERLPLLDNVNLKIIELGTKEDFDKIFTLLASAKTSLSEQDKLDITWFIETYGNEIAPLLPDEISIKENLTYIGNLLINQTAFAKEFLSKHIKTATDVLRLAAAMSAGDVSLAKPTKFKTFSRPYRKLLLGLLENCGNSTEDMLRWKKRWIRLGEKLHAGEFKRQFPKSFNAFDILRNDKPFETFNGKVEKSLKLNNSENVVSLLQNRAGDFARRLDHILRIDNAKQTKVLDEFERVAENISTPVLLQVLTHFKHRNSNNELRTFFPKGDVAKVKAIENKLPRIAGSVCKSAVNICENTLIERFSKLKPLGKCYLDEQLKNYLVPFSQRSASKSLRTLVRGSKIPLPDSNVIRFFLWWKNGRDRTDIDLSAAMYDEKLIYKDILSYYNLSDYGGCHSGDIVDAPEGAAEFIDIDIGKTIEQGVRYVVMSLNSFTSQPYCDLPECFAGWMARTHADSGEIFEPKTVQDRIDLAADTTICIPLIIDLFEREVFWTDIALKKSPNWNNVHNNLKGVSLMAKALTSLKKTTLYDLFDLHIKARGEFVNSVNDAKTCFTVEDVEPAFDVKDEISPFNIDLIASEFM